LLLLLASQGASAFGMMNVGDLAGRIRRQRQWLPDPYEMRPGTTGPEMQVWRAALSGRIATSATSHGGPAAFWFGFHATQEKNGFKQGITIGFQPGIDSIHRDSVLLRGGLGLNSQLPPGVLEYSGKDWGGFKVGRDLGLFGSDAILSDMTLLGVGTTAPTSGRWRQHDAGTHRVWLCVRGLERPDQYTSPTGAASVQPRRRRSWWSRPICRVTA
jgi:hypothetical protein